jgi:hypothetical protein
MPTRKRAERCLSSRRNKTHLPCVLSFGPALGLAFFLLSLSSNDPASLLYVDEVVADASERGIMPFRVAVLRVLAQEIEHGCERSETSFDSMWNLRESRVMLQHAREQ